MTICQFFLLFAEAEGERILTLLLGSAGGTGFAIWTAWYMLTRVLPGREAAFTTERAEAERRCQERFDAMEKRHADHFERERLDNREDMHEAWKTVREDNERIVSALDRLVERIEKDNGSR